MQLWHNFINSLKSDLNDDALDHWLQGIRVIHFDAQNLYLEAKDQFHLNWFEEHIRPIAFQRFRNNNNKIIKIHLSLNEENIESRSRNDVKQERKEFHIEFEVTPLDSSKTFESFICEENNQVAIKLLQEINPENPGFNPIFLNGPSGSGKTHLLMAACQKLQSEGYKVLYVHANLFTEQVVQAIRSSQMHKFRSLYRHIDFLAVDDVHLLAKKLATQEEFFHTFNALHIPGKPILLSSNVTPSDLKEIEPRLISRFEWGLSLPLFPLSTITYANYLDNKLQDLAFPLSPSSKAFILKNFGKTVETVNKALETLLLRSHLHKHDMLSLEQVTEHLKDMLQNSETKALTVDMILYEVSSAFKIKTKDILGKSQTKECALPRQVSMYFLREELKLPFKKIGEIFGRDHSTVMSSIKMVQERFNNRDEELFEPLKEIKQKFAEYEKALA